MRRGFVVTCNRPPLAAVQRTRVRMGSVPARVLDSSYRAFVAWWCAEYLRIRVRVQVRKISLIHAPPKWQCPRNFWHGTPSVPWVALQSMWLATVGDLTMLHAASKQPSVRHGAQEQLPIDSETDLG